MRLALAAPFTLAVLAFALPARPQAVVDVEALRLAYYDYDPTASLNPDLQPMPEPSASQSELRTRFHLAFDSAHDQRVTAIFTVPRKFAPPYPAVVLLAGSGGHKDTDYIRISSDMMSTLGYATISIDAQYHGERSRPGRSGDIHLSGTATNGDRWVET